MVMGMYECKECFHYDVCCKLIGKDKIDRVSWMCHFPDQCSEFKNRTNCVEVVRCKDCKHYKKDSFWCCMNSEDRGEWFNWYEDDFCSYGERREGE